MPVDPFVLLAFVPASLALNLTPGADMMFSLGQGLRGGARAGLAAAAGISAGSMVQALLAGMGLAAVIAALPGAFEAIRWVGVAYLLWLAAQSLRNGPLESRAGTGSRAFRDALFVSLSNPKTLLFTLAFIPQFVDPARPVLAQFLLFGAVLSLGGLAVNGMVGGFAGGIGRTLARSPGFARALSHVSAGVFTALALRLAMMERT